MSDRPPPPTTLAEALHCPIGGTRDDDHAHHPDKTLKHCTACKEPLVDTADGWIRVPERPDPALSLTTLDWFRDGPR